MTGGIPPYICQWITTDAIHFSEDIFNLEEGTYQVNVTDANGCLVTGSNTVDEPANPVVVNGTVTDATSETSNDGEIDVSVTGGTLPYSYNWSNGSTSGDLTGLAPGVYTVEVTDGAGCSVSNTFTVNYTMGLGDMDNTYSIAIYPNPASELLNITVTDADVTFVKLIDLQGKVIYSDQSGDKQIMIPLDNFADGIYFANIHTSKGVTTEKVVVTKL